MGGAGHPDTNELANKLTEEHQTRDHGETDRNPDITVERAADRQIDRRWFLYPAYVSAMAAGGIAAQFALGSEEWAVGPVLLAWGLLFLWYWLYGVAFHYRRPVLKYFALAGALGFGGLLTTFCLDRAPPQLAPTGEGAAIRTFELDLLWAGLATGLGAALVGLHAILFSRSR